MRIDALLLTRDFLLQRAVERSAREYAINIEQHTSGQRVLQRLAEWKFAAIIADCDHDDGFSALQATRLERRNRNSIVIAAARHGLSLGVPFSCGANFALEKPVTRDRVCRLLRAAYGLIAREHFRYLRHPLDVPVTTFLHGRPVQSRSRNVSTRGLGVQTPHPGRWPSSVRVRFQLAGNAIESEAEVIWADSHGRAGLRLVGFHPASQRGFDTWLHGRTEFLSAALVPQPLPRRVDTLTQGYSDGTYS